MKEERFRRLLRKIALPAFLIVLVLTFGFSLWSIARGNESVTGGPSPVPGASTPTAVDSWPEKEAILSGVGTQQALARLEQPTRPSNSRQLHPSLTVVAQGQSGIIESPSVPFHSGDVRINNAWKSEEGSSYLIAYAGWLPADPAQGIVIIYSDATHKTARYPTPDKRGAVRIVEVKGSRLILTSEDGDVFYFDILALCYARDLDEVLPTITPLPSEAATASPWGMLTPYP